MAAPKKIHVVSRVYLKNWARGGSVISVDARTGRRERKPVAQAAARRRVWGRHAEVRRQAEERLGAIESETAPILASPERHWPIAGRPRAVLGAFIAMHIVRSPAYRQWNDVLAFNAAAREARARPELLGREAEILEALNGDLPRTQSILGQIPHVASAAGSMHWTLIRFDEPLLLTSDQPVVLVGLGADAGHVAVSPMPPDGIMNTLEWRIALTPWHALLLAWHDAPDTIRVLAGTVAQASSLNAACAAQADRHWFHRDGRIPARIAPGTLAPDCGLLAPELLPGYGSNAAIASRRRREAAAVISDLQEREIHDTITSVIVTPGALAA
ncbi:MAG: DUF4238 domain-containing protein [Solirubrobacteraceae bacterium]